ncbi:MAG: hypothetical protein Q3993_05650 [Filifactor alocis]|nr:hypothetical protein [Filifactor alocis]
MQLASVNIGPPSRNKEAYRLYEEEGCRIHVAYFLKAVDDVLILDTEKFLFFEHLCARNLKTQL